MRITNYSKPVDKEKKRKAREKDLKNIVDGQMQMFQERMKKHFDEEKFMPFLELEHYTYTTRQTLSKWSKGISSSADIADLCTIANLLNCEIGYLLGEFDCKNRKVADVKQETGLSEQTIGKLKVEKACGDNEIASFIDWLVSHSEFVHFIKIIDKANSFAENPKTVLADIGDTVETMDMFSIYKTHASDMFWKIVGGYRINSMRIEGETNAE